MRAFSCFCDIRWLQSADRERTHEGGGNRSRESTTGSPDFGAPRTRDAVGTRNGPSSSIPHDTRAFNGARSTGLDIGWRAPACQSPPLKAKLATRLPIGTYGSRGRARVAFLIEMPMNSELVQAKLAEALATVPSGALASAQRIVFEVVDDMVRVSFEPATPCRLS